MIVWSGWGILAAVFPIVGYVLGTLAVKAAVGQAYTDTHGWPGALGTLLGAAAVWLLAQKLKAPGRMLVDPQTGQTVTLRRRDSLFFIPMEYWAYILVAVAVVVLLKHRSQV